MTQRLIILAIFVALLTLTSAAPVNSTLTPTMEATQQQQDTLSPPTEKSSAQKSTVTAKTPSGMSPSPVDGLPEDVTSLSEEELTENPMDVVPSQSEAPESSSPSISPESSVSMSAGKTASVSPMESAEILTDSMETGSLSPVSSQEPPIQSPAANVTEETETIPSSESVFSSSVGKPLSISPMEVSAEMLTDAMETGSSLSPVSSQEPPIQGPAANSTEQTETIPSSESVFSSSKSPTQASIVLSTTKQSAPLPSSKGRSTEKPATSLTKQHKSPASSSVPNNPSTQNPAVPPQIQLSSLPPIDKSTQNPAVTSTTKPRTTFSPSPQKSTVTKKRKPIASSTSKFSTRRHTTVTMVTNEEEPLLSGVEKQESSKPSVTTLVVVTGVVCSVGTGIMSAICYILLNKVSQNGLPTKKLFKKLRQKAKEQQSSEIEEESGENEISSLIDKESDLNSLQDKIEKRENKRQLDAVVDMDGSAFEMSPLLKKGSTFDPQMDMPEKLSPPKADKEVQTEPVELRKEERKPNGILKKGLPENGYEMPPLQSKESNSVSPEQNVAKDDQLDLTLSPVENKDKTSTSPSEESSSNSSEETLTAENEEKQQLLTDDAKGEVGAAFDRGEITPLLGNGSTQL